MYIMLEIIFIISEVTFYRVKELSKLACISKVSEWPFERPYPRRRENGFLLVFLV
jgi:hypothetical protein